MKKSEHVIILKLALCFMKNIILLKTRHFDGVDVNENSISNLKAYISDSEFKALTM